MDEHGRRLETHDTMSRILVIDNCAIFQGGWLAAHDLDRMREHNIGLIINCTTNVPLPRWRQMPDTPECVIFPIFQGEFCEALDRGQGLMVLEPLFEKVRNTMNDRAQNVMIHCKAGAHRAGIMGVIFTMYYLKIPIKEAIRHVRSKRSCTCVIGRNLELVQAIAREMEVRAAPAAAPAAPKSRPKAAPAAAPAAFAPAATAPLEAGATWKAAPGTRPLEAGTTWKAPPGARSKAAPATSSKSPPAAPPAALADAVVLVALSDSDSDPNNEDEVQLGTAASSSSTAAPKSQPAPPAAPAAPPAAPAAEVSAAPPAAPAADNFSRMTYREAVSRLLFMSWNPGSGVRKLAQVIDTGGYHVVAVQEAREDFLGELDKDRWSYTLNYQQFIGVRKPNTVQSVGGEETMGKIRWHFAIVHFPEKRVQRHTLGILSVHLNNIQAKKPCGGPWTLGEAIDKAGDCDPNRDIDIISGDINLARWKNKSEADDWHEGTLVVY